MTTQQLTTQLTEKHKAFAEAIAALDSKDFTTSTNGKWTPGQQLLHIYVSMAAVTQALGLPKILPRLLFGKANRPLRDYDGVVAAYHAKLGAGGKASGKYDVKPVDANQQQALKSKMQHKVQKLTDSINTFSEEQLDTLMLPHPLLGKMTIREMLYFTLYHVQHHHEVTLKNLPTTATQPV
jgi:hypothetical protein